MTATYVPLINAYGMLSDLGDTIGSQNAAQEAAAKELWQRAQASAIASGQEPPPMPAPRQGMLQRLMGAINPTVAPQAPQQPVAVAGQPQVSTPIAEAPQDGNMPRGLRNMNPGNIEAGRFTQSQPGYVGSDGRFAKFDTLEHGVGAHAALLEGYGRKGINTVAGVINRWAPQAENGAATGNYAQFVARKIGVDPNAPIDLSNPETRTNLAYAMGEFENGRPIGSGQTGQNVQMADASGRVSFGGQPQTASAPANDAMRAWPKALQTLPGIMSAMQNPYMKPIAEKALDAYNKANVGRPTVLSAEEAQRKYNAPPDFKGIVFEDEKGQPHIQKFGPDAQTTVNLAGEKEYERTVGKGYGETMLDLQKQGRAAQNSITSLKLMEKAIDTPGFYSGSSSDAVTAARKVAVSLGIADAASAAPNELFTKISNKLVLDLAGGSLGTGFSNADRDYLASSVPNLANTPEGNKQIIQIMKKVEGRRAEVAKFARDYAKFHGGRLDQGFDDALAQWTEQNQLFPEGEKANAAAKAPPKLGSVPIPPDRARALRQHPDLRDAFDQTYGKGAADQVLGATSGPQL